MFFRAFFLQACKNGRVQHLEHLLFYGAEMNIQNSSGNTPLHVCAVNNQVSVSTVHSHTHALYGHTTVR